MFWRVETRDFRAKDVPVKFALRILEAGVQSPSAMNSQPWRLILIRDRHILEEISKVAPTGRFIAKASFAVAAAMEKSRWTDFDGGRLVQNMVVTACMLGIGSCMVWGVDEDRVRKLLGISSEFRILTVLPFGYPKGGLTSRRKRRRKLGEVAFAEKYGGSLPHP